MAALGQYQPLSLSPGERLESAMSSRSRSFYEHLHLDSDVRQHQGKLMPCR